MAIQRRCKVIGTYIDVLGWVNAIDIIHSWSKSRSSKYVCICNAHSLVTAKSNVSFKSALDSADLATADGAPVAWMMRRLGFPAQIRVNGPDLMWHYCANAELSGEKIYLYGGTQATLDILKGKLIASFPKLVIAGAYSPPFRPLTAEEDERIINDINQSGAGTVWVSLGCPKQEIWMLDHLNKIQAVMIGVGAAFDYHAGVIKRAPLWMQLNGLEWLHRLWSEPKRLWKRYFVTNLLFIYYASIQILARVFNK